MSVEMDPWTSCQTSAVIKSPVNATGTVALSFEDDFEPLVRHSLPDSAEYLAILESRLEKIRSDPNLLRQLTEKREACMRQLMREDSFHEYSEETWRFEEPVEDSPVLRVVAPHKQALTLGETVQFLHYDQLGSESEEVAKREE